MYDKPHKKIGLDMHAELVCEEGIMLPLALIVEAMKWHGL